MELEEKLLIINRPKLMTCTVSGHLWFVGYFLLAKVGGKWWGLEIFSDDSMW